MKQNEESIMNFFIVLSNKNFVEANFLLLSRAIDKVLETDEAKAKNMFGRYQISLKQSS